MKNEKKVGGRKGFFGGWGKTPLWGGIFISGMILALTGVSNAVAESPEFALELRVAVERAIEELHATGEPAVAEVMHELLPETLEAHGSAHTPALEGEAPLDAPEPEPGFPSGWVEASEFPGAAGVSTSLQHAEHAAERSIEVRIALLSEFDKDVHPSVDLKPHAARDESLRLLEADVDRGDRVADARDRAFDARDRAFERVQNDKAKEVVAAAGGGRPADVGVGAPVEPGPPENPGKKPK